MLFCVVNIIAWAMSQKSVYSDTMGDVNTSFMMTATVLNLTTFFLVYLSSEYNVITDNGIWNFFKWMFVLGIISYMFTSRSMDSSSTAGDANNDGYLIIFLFLILSLKGFDQKNLVLFFLVLGLVVISSKRGALLCFAFVSLFYIYFRFINGKKVSKSVIFGVPIFMAVMFLSVLWMYQHDANLQTRVEATAEGQTSGRDVMYEKLFFAWLQADTDKQLFGLQYAGAFQVVGLTAHNDWLDLLISCGMTGVMSYLILFLSLFNIYRKNRMKFRDYEKFCYLSAVSVWFIKSFFSQAYYGREVIYSIIIIGYLSALAVKRRQALLERA